MTGSHIILNGYELTEDQVSAIKVAVALFRKDLANPKIARVVADGMSKTLVQTYSTSLDEVIALMQVPG